MKKLLNLSIAFIALCMTSCSNEPESRNDTLAPVPVAKEVPKVEAKIVKNEVLDSVFALMVDTAKKYFPTVGTNIEWKDPDAYQRDSVGNRIVNARYSIEGRMSGMSGSCVIKIEQATADTIITQSIPYSDGSFEKSVNKLKKGEIVISVENIIFAHSKKKDKVLSSLIKVLDEQVFAYGGEVFGIKAQMN